jgi:hypothetical protein
MLAAALAASTPSGAQEISPPTTLQATVGDTIAETLSTAPGDLVAIDGGLALPLDAEMRWSTPGNHWTAVADGEDVRWAIVEVDGQASGSRFPSATVRLDRAPPTARFDIDGPEVPGSPPLISSETTVKALLEDPSGVVQARLSANGREFPAEHGVSGLSEGPQRVGVQATDGAGNAGLAGELELLVDNSGPRIEWQIERDGRQGADGQTYYTPPVRLEFSALDDGAGVAEITVIDGDQSTAFSESGRVELAASSAIIEATDRLGNRSRIEASWNYDGEGPEIQFLLEDGSRPEENLLRVKPGGKVTIEVSDSGAGVDTVEYRINQRQWKPLAGSIRFVDRGWYQLEVRARDRFGNDSTAYRDVRTGNPRALRPDNRELIDEQG